MDRRLSNEGARTGGAVGRRSRGALAAVAVAALAVGTAWGAGPTFYAAVDHPVLYQGQSFPEGRIELVPVGNGNLLALRLDGQRVAMVFAQSLGAHRVGRPPEFCFRRVGDALELAEVRWSGTPVKGRVEVLLVVRAQVGSAPG